MGASFVFAYPPDLRALIVAIYETVGLTPSGEVWGLQLTSFLQMLNADLKTCAVTVQAGAESGQLFLQEGELIAAECGAETGDDALYTHPELERSRASNWTTCPSSGRAT
jgi:hypothetical protein